MFTQEVLLFRARLNLRIRRALKFNNHSLSLSDHNLETKIRNINQPEGNTFEIVQIFIVTSLIEVLERVAKSRGDLLGGTRIQCNKHPDV